MKIWQKSIIVIFAIILCIIAFFFRPSNRVEAENHSLPSNKIGGLPRLLELGSTTCQPCKMMEHVLEELSRKYSSQLVIEFSDVTKDPSIGEKFKIKLIPTQIFLSAEGKELFRHEGFFPEQEIVAKWLELGITLNSSEKIGNGGKNNQGLLFSLFATLSDAVGGSTIIALSAAFLWGIFSILLSPCHLASIPLIIGFIDEQGPSTTRRAFFISFLFALGILLSIGLIGLFTGFAGRLIGDIGPLGNYFVALIFLFFGLHLMNVFPFKWNPPSQSGMKKKGFLAAFILGLVFGIALGPCTFAYMAPMLGIVFKTAANSVLYGIFLLGIYGIGHCSVIVFAGTSTEVIQKYLNWNEKSKGAEILKSICGFFIILGGAYLIYTS